MKLARICMAVVATLIFASVCAAQCGPAKAKATGSVEDAIIEHERQILEAIKKRDANAFKSLVDMNGTEVGSMGARKISEGLSELFSPDLTFAEIKMEDPQVMMLGKDAAILTYKSSGTATMKGKTESGMSFDTTVYAKRGGKWIAVFHQTSEMPKTHAESMTGEK
jgi:hypothetical protein